MRLFSIWLERCWKGMCHICSIVQNITYQPSIRCAPASIQHNVGVTADCGPPRVRTQGLNGWVGPQCLAVWFVRTHMCLSFCSPLGKFLFPLKFKEKQKLSHPWLLTFALVFLALTLCVLLKLLLDVSRGTPLRCIACLPKGCSYSFAEMESCDAQFQERLVIPFEEIGRGEQYWVINCVAVKFWQLEDIGRGYQKTQKQKASQKLEDWEVGRWQGP